MPILDLADAKTISLSAFSLGVILDFFLLNYRDDIWLRGRELFGTLDKVQFKSLHRLIAKRLIALVWYSESSARSDLSSFVLVLASIAWSFTGLFLISPSALGSNTLADIQNLYKVFLLCGFAGATLGVFHIAHDWRVAKQSQAFKDWVNNSPEWVQTCYYWTLVPFYCTFFVFLAGLGIGGILLLFWFGVYPPFPAARSAAILFVVNLVGDWASFRVTYFVLKRIAFAKMWWAIAGPVVDVLAAMLIRVIVAVVTMAALVQPTTAHGGKPTSTESAGFILLVVWLSLSVFMPTICVAATMIVAYVYKAIFIGVTLIAKAFVNQAIPPDHDTVVRPFAALGAIAAIATWALYAFQAII